MRHAILIGFLACAWGFPPKGISIQEAHYPVLVENSNILIKNINAFIKKVDSQLEGQNAQLANVWKEVKSNLTAAVENLSSGMTEGLTNDRLQERFYNGIVAFRNEPKKLLKVRTDKDEQIQKYAEEAELTANSLFSKLSHEYLLGLGYKPTKGFLAYSWAFPPKGNSIKEAHYLVLAKKSKFLMEKVDSFIKKVDLELEGQNSQLANVWKEVKSSINEDVEDLSNGLKEELPNESLQRKFYNLIAAFRDEPQNLLQCQTANDEQIKEFAEEAERTANSLFSELSDEYLLQMGFNLEKGLDGSSSRSKE